jgi:hypothetical protein
MDLSWNLPQVNNNIKHNRSAESIPTSFLMLSRYIATGVFKIYPMQASIEQLLCQIGVCQHSCRAMDDPAVPALVMAAHALRLKRICPAIFRKVKQAFNFHFRILGATLYGIPVCFRNFNRAGYFVSKWKISGKDYFTGIMIATRILSSQFVHLPEFSVPFSVVLLHHCHGVDIYRL